MATCSWAVYLPSSDFKHSEGEILEQILNNKWCGSNSLPGSGRELFSCIRVFFHWLLVFSTKRATTLTILNELQRPSCTLPLFQKIAGVCSAEIAAQLESSAKTQILFQ